MPRHPLKPRDNASGDFIANFHSAQIKPAQSFFNPGIKLLCPKANKLERTIRKIQRLCAFRQARFRNGLSQSFARPALKGRNAERVIKNIAPSSIGWISRRICFGIGHTVSLR